MINFIQNIGDYFSSNYFDEDFYKKVKEKSGHADNDVKVFQKRISSLKEKYFRFKQTYLDDRMRTKDKITETHQFHTEVLKALGYPGGKPEYKQLFPLDEKNVIPVRHTLYRGEQPHLMIMEMQALISDGGREPDGLFDQRYHQEKDESAFMPQAQEYDCSDWSNVFEVKEDETISPMIINKAISQLFLIAQHRRPQYILLCAGNQYFLLEQEKWFKGAYLQFDIEALFDEVTGTKKKDYYSLFYFLLAKNHLAPQSEIVLMEQLDEDSHKSAFEVTKDLKEGVIHAVESLANEAVYYLQNNNPDDISNLDAQDLKNDCLTMVYRLLFLFYAESRNDLDILPVNDEAYQHGYSLEMLRDLEQVPLNTDSSQNGFFFHESLSRLFYLLNHGCREEEQLNKSFRVRQLDSPLFDDAKLHILPHVKIRNVIWQDVICQLSLSKKQKRKARGRISYANLGINQLGSVYESLLAFRGFFAETDYIEVHRKLKKKETSEQVARKDGSYLVPRHRMDDFDIAEVYHDREDKIKIIPKGTFIYRLSGRDRKKSASFYTPEVLTECTVKYTLKPILERVTNGEMKALDLLDLKILEPAMGAAAFHNEVINQLAEAYLSFRQDELGRKAAPDKYQEELQKIKAYIALNNVYGVDLNPTAVELGKLSLWLNVIHKDMQTPFFGYRLGVGNAVVGAWLKVYPQKAFVAEYTSQRAKKMKKKEWWDTAPIHLKYEEGKLKRKKSDIYHFLLPDKNMVPSAKIKLLKEAYPNEAKRVIEWRKDFIQPLSMGEVENLKLISIAIDKLLEEHYEFQQRINIQTQIKTDFFGAHEKGEQVKLKAKSYDEKEKMAAMRSQTNAPYYKLKLIMDYWCSLWFWDVRDAFQLPSRQEWYQDIVNILNIDLQKLAEETVSEDPVFKTAGQQGNLFGGAQQLTLKSYKKEKTSVQKKIAEVLKEQKTSLFKNDRSKLVMDYANKYSFFHYQLEFIEVYKERKGFDVVVGNPPWVNIEMDEAGIISEEHPEIAIRKMSAPQVKKMAMKILSSNKELNSIYKNEATWADSTKDFLGGYQNYPLLKGQRNNLYKCILTNTFQLTSQNGFIGLVHPEGIYDDPKGQPLRKDVYRRLKYHFQFWNALKLFVEIKDSKFYSINVYSGLKSEIQFVSMSNIFSTSTVYGSFIDQDNNKGCGGIKKRNKEGEFIWNTSPHRDRLVYYTKEELSLIAKTFENSNDWETTKLVSLHSRGLLHIIRKLGEKKSRTLSQDFFTTDGLNEVNAQKENILLRKTSYPTNKAIVFNGAQVFLSTSFYKNPKQECKLNSDYDIINLTEIEERFIPRTNFLPLDTDRFNDKIEGLNNLYWIKSTRIGFRKMLDNTSLRTLHPVLIPPDASHTNGIISIQFKNDYDLLKTLSLCSSIILDFYIKSLGKNNLYDETIQNLFLEVNNSKCLDQLFVRALMLNCLSNQYSVFWNKNWQESFKQSNWSKEDSRLKSFHTLTENWQWETPLRNWYERRWALVEIDVIVAMALGLTLDELILIYNVQFPVLQQNEDDTWYDTKGNIVFTCSKGLTGVGLDRPVWNTIKEMTAGETYVHTIEKSELYYGKQVTYYAPFDKCDRVADYKVAWGHFEEVFK
ncbi:Eco57I restriction-modification methylase domain-containing protein [Aureispira sp. CCB-E]|uniref:Eco57I restriction-modification methylase domain-containing protein n=1 Tax=Aureispira sp. CCB-E TaxID=3051121 RepID=UPI002868F7E8|nr:hypothetical protein [Aureispira sp. CCB-E]WMX16506.1 hypothetical protein QP953_09020 [Aureispira sp. CCB-E]